MGQTSARSSMIFSLTVETREVPEGECLKVGTVYLVDLAGSERINKSSAVAALKEAVNMNASLRTLGTVLSALYDSTKFVPYRDSKLTRILQPALTKDYNSIVLCVCVSPTTLHYDETLSSLRFAFRLCDLVEKKKKIGTVSSDC